MINLNFWNNKNNKEKIKEEEKNKLLVQPIKFIIN